MLVRQKSIKNLKPHNLTKDEELEIEVLDLDKSQ